MPATRPAEIQTGPQQKKPTVAPSTPSPTTRNKRKKCTGLPPHAADMPASDSQQQRLCTPKSLKRRPGDLLGSANSKRSRRGAAVSFSPHLSIVHEFESDSPSKRRLDYRSCKVAVLDDEQVRLELDVQGHKIPANERVNASHRALVEQMHAQDLVLELKRAGLEPQPKTLPAVSKLSSSSTSTTPVSTPILAAMTGTNRPTVASSTARDTRASGGGRQGTRSHSSASKENAAVVQSTSSTPADATPPKFQSSDVSVEKANEAGDYSIKQLRTRVKVSNRVCRVKPSRTINYIMQGCTAVVVVLRA
jgi:hypothetical protein